MKNEFYLTERTTQFQIQVRSSVWAFAEYTPNLQRPLIYT